MRRRISHSLVQPADAILEHYSYHGGFYHLTHGSKSTSRQVFRAAHRHPSRHAARSITRQVARCAETSIAPKRIIAGLFAYSRRSYRLGALRRHAEASAAYFVVTGNTLAVAGAGGDLAHHPCTRRCLRRTTHKTLRGVRARTYPGRRQRVKFRQEAIAPLVVPRNRRRTLIAFIAAKRLLLARGSAAEFRTIQRQVLTKAHTAMAASSPQPACRPDRLGAPTITFPDESRRP